MRRSLGVLTFVLSCSGSDPDAAASAQTSADAPKMLQAAEDDPSVSASSTSKAATMPIVPIPGGTFIAGSTPGDRGRDPRLESPPRETELTAFDMDRAVYPNTDGDPPLRASREKASSLCEARGRRLCTELEWERACKGPEGEPYAGRKAWDAACLKDPSRCASGFGIVGMGAFAEWTSSQVISHENVKKGPVIKGAPASASELDRRCAHRTAGDQGFSSEVTFRCCGGRENAAVVVGPKPAPTFEKASKSEAEVRALLETIPELTTYSKDFTFFDEAKAISNVLARAKLTDPPKGYVLSTAPIAWRPILGEDLLIATGVAGTSSIIVALHVLPDGRHRVASSLVLKGDTGPLLLAFDRSVALRLEWSTCWQCPAETGRITYRDDGRVIITQE